MKENYYWKVTYTALVIILLFAIIVNVGLIGVKWGIEKVKKDVIDEFYKCEFEYDNLHYKGICNEELLDNAQALIEFDKQMELLEFCMSSPYSYRYGMCENLQGD